MSFLSESRGGSGGAACIGRLAPSRLRLLVSSPWFLSLSRICRGRISLARPGQGHRPFARRRGTPNSTFLPVDPHWMEHKPSSGGVFKPPSHHSPSPHTRTYSDIASSISPRPPAWGGGGTRVAFLRLVSLGCRGATGRSHRSVEEGGIEPWNLGVSAIPHRLRPDLDRVSSFPPPRRHRLCWRTTSAREGLKYCATTVY